MSESPNHTTDDEARALAAFNRTRGPLPRAVQVAVRPNIRRLASLTRTRTAAPVLNLAEAVVAAGREAWELVAPALRGDRKALARLRELAAPGVEEARRERVVRRGRNTGGGSRRGSEARLSGRNGTRPEGGGQDGSDPGSAPFLPEPACDGTDAQRTYLRTLIAFVRETSGHGDALPDQVQLRISKRMTSSLGLCARAGDTHRVTIAERLFRPGLEEILLDTVKHELAHLADQNTSPNGRSSHGARWKEWARRLGARPERLGSRDTVRRIQAANRRGRQGVPAYPNEVRSHLTSRGGDRDEEASPEPFPTSGAKGGSGGRGAPPEPR